MTSHSYILVDSPEDEGIDTFESIFDVKLGEYSCQCSGYLKVGNQVYKLTKTYDGSLEKVILEPLHFLALVDIKFGFYISNQNGKRVLAAHLPGVTETEFVDNAHFLSWALTQQYNVKPIDLLAFSMIQGVHKGFNTYRTALMDGYPRGKALLHTDIFTLYREVTGFNAVSVIHEHGGQATQNGLFSPQAVTVYLSREEGIKTTLVTASWSPPPQIY